MSQPFEDGIGVPVYGIGSHQQLCSDVYEALGNRKESLFALAWTFHRPLMVFAIVAAILLALSPIIQFLFSFASVVDRAAPIFVPAGG